MNWVVRLSFVLMAVAVAFAIFLASAYQRLSITVERQKSQIETQQVALRVIDTAVARRSSDLAALRDALVANEDLLPPLGDESYDRYCPPGRPGFTTRENNFCELLRQYAEPFARFLTRYTAVTGVRGAAETRGDFARLRGSYAALLPVAEGARVGNEWLARVHEGIAHADFRLGNLAQAEVEIGQADRLDPNSAFAALTALKIACSRHVPADRIRAQYNDRLTRLERAVRLARPGTPRRYAGLELRYLQEDRELPFVCAYAGLPAARRVAGA